MTRLGHRSAADALAQRLARAHDLPATYRRWARVWVMMPEVAIRVARAVTVSIPAQGRPGTLIGQAFGDGARAIDQLLCMGNTLALIQDAMRAILSRCLLVAQFEVHVGDQLWLPREHGPLSVLTSRAPAAGVHVALRAPTMDAATQDIHHLLKHHVFCSVCETTLRTSYESLMGLGEVQACR